MQNGLYMEQQRRKAKRGECEKWTVLTLNHTEKTVMRFFIQINQNDVHRIQQKYHICFLTSFRESKQTGVRVIFSSSFLSQTQYYVTTW